MKIRGRIVVVTGASSGIGSAIARIMAAAGAQVILLSRNHALLEKEVAKIVSRGGAARAYAVDLSDSQAVDRVAGMIGEEVGIVDILVNNAGAGRWLFVEETGPEEAGAMMAAPYFAAFNATRAFLPDMLARNSGHIVNITSVAAYVPWSGATGYSAARWAMRGFNNALRADLYRTNIRVSLITPGEVNSPYWEHNPGSHDRLPKIASLYPKMTPEQVGKVVVQAVETHKREVIVPFLMRLTVGMHRIFPRMVEWLVYQTGWQRKQA